MTDNVLLTKLCLDYPTHSLLKVQNVFRLAENLYSIGTDDYYDYIDAYTEPTEKNIANIMFESIALNESTREYMGVTIYKEDDGKYSVPELGIYNVVGSSNLKDYIKSKLIQKNTRTFSEECETVVNNINSLVEFDENQFLNFVLNEMTESDYEVLDGTNFKNFVLIISEIIDGDWEVPPSLIMENYIFDEGVGDFIKKIKGAVSDAHLELAYKSPNIANTLGDAYTRHDNATKALKDKLENIGSKVKSTTNALGDAYGRHSAATKAAGQKISDAKDKAGRIYSKVDKILSPAPRSRKDTAAAKEKVSRVYGAVDKVLSPPPMSKENKDALKQKGSNVGGILDRMILSPRPSKKSVVAPTETTTKPRSNVPERGRIANDILDKLKTDGDAEKAENKIVARYKPKKISAAEREAALEKKYDEVMKEDFDTQLEFIKDWLYENEIFDNLEDIDNYILEDMTSEEYATIISEISDEDGDHEEELKSLTKEARSSKLKKTGAKMSPKERRNITDTNTALDTAVKFGTRYPNNYIGNTGGKSNRFMTIAQRLDAGIDSGIDKLSKINRDNNPYYGGDIYGSVTPPKPLDIKKNNSAFRQNGGILATASETSPSSTRTKKIRKSESIVEPYRSRSTNGGTNTPTQDRMGGKSSVPQIDDKPLAKPLGRAIPGNQHSLIPTPRTSASSNSSKTYTPIIPHVRGQVTDRNRNTTYSDKGAMFKDTASLRSSELSRDAAYRGALTSTKMISDPNNDGRFKDKYTHKTPHIAGQLTNTRTGITTYNDDGQGFADSLKNSLGKAKVKPSSLISTIGKKSKSIAKNVIGGIKRKLYGEELAESDIKNFITEEEFLEITEYLVEYDIFEDDQELEYFLLEKLDWELLDIIHENIENDAIKLIIECLCDEETSEQTYLVLESLIGEDIDILIEEASTMVASDVNESPMPMKLADCSCGKFGCKSCSKSSWKSKVYDKMKEDK
jgi:hypothetical protein